MAEVDRFASGGLPIGTSGSHYLPPRQLEEMAGGIDLPWNARSGSGPSPLSPICPSRFTVARSWGLGLNSETPGA